MLNSEGLGVEVSKIENELTNVPPAEVEKKKQKKKVHFSDKNETIYYEKDETEHNTNFGIALNNFNYFECFYNKLYNGYDFDENYEDAEFSPLNEEEEDGDSSSFIEFHEGPLYEKHMELESDLEKDSEGDESSVNRGTTKELNEEMKVVNYTGGVEKASGLTRGNGNVRGQKSTIGNKDIKYKNEGLKRSDFTQSFNEDSSFEINNIKKAIYDAEEKAPTYNAKEYFGYEIDPFNMKNELKEGYIDKFGNYIYNEEYDNDEVEEAWLKSVDEKDPLTTFSNERLKNKLHKEIYAKFNEENKNTEDFYQSVNIYDALFSLCALLIEKETPLKAMVRYKTDLQACGKALSDYKKQIEQFSAAHAHVLNTGSQMKEQNEKVEKRVENKKQLPFMEKWDESCKEKTSIVQINIKTRGKDQKNGQEENVAETQKKTELISSKAETESTETNKEEAAGEEKVNHEEKNKPTEAKEEQVEKGTEGETDKNEAAIKQEEETVKQEVNEKQKIIENEVKENKKNEIELKVMNKENSSSTGKEKIVYESSTESLGAENSLVNQNATEDAAVRTTNGTRDEELWREYQQMLMVYQKLELDYKTIERRFNNLIDLTQKLTNEYKNVYFLTKGEFEKLYKKLEKYKEDIEIKWQFKWSNDYEDNAYGPYNYTDIYQWISVGYVSAINPIHLRRINKDNEVIENIWQVYDSINYLIFVSNENVKKKAKLEELSKHSTTENSQNKEETNDAHESVTPDTNEDEDDDSIEGAEFDISNRKRKKKKGLIQISKKKAKHNKRNASGNDEEEDDDDDDDEDDDDYDDYEF